MLRGSTIITVFAALMVSCATHAPSVTAPVGGAVAASNARSARHFSSTLEGLGSEMAAGPTRAVVVERALRERERAVQAARAGSSAASLEAALDHIRLGALGGVDRAERGPTEWLAPWDLSGRERKRLARANKLREVRGLFAEAGLSWPPKRLVWRAFKLEHELEVWASDRDAGPLVRVTTYGICRLSGALGPKREEGDGQVPEGFYELDRFNSESNFFLSMRVSYPNRSDRRRTTNPSEPGSAIMIHGDCVSIGCLAMSDERIQELWLMARALRPFDREVQMHILPTREMEALIEAADAERAAFWRELQALNLRFLETTRRVDFRIDDAGRYLLR